MKHFLPSLIVAGVVASLAACGVRADLNLTHPADLNLTRGWVPAL